MPDAFSDSPMSASGTGRNQLSPSTHKRNTRNRKPRPQSSLQSDGVVSESALNPAMSPKLRKANKAKQNVTTSTMNGQNAHNARKPSSTTKRPISMHGSGADTPLKEQAYAGPTFQASPAASALPIPKFFSKSAPNAADNPSLQARLAGDRTPEDQPSSPEPDVVGAALPSRDTQQSPLDLFFKADRAEREKIRAVSHGSQPVTLMPPLSGSNMARPIPSSGSSKSALFSELNGDRDDLPDRNSGTDLPKSQSDDQIPQSPIAGLPSSDEERQAHTQSLKNLLFNTATQSLSTPPRQYDDHLFGSQSPESVYLTPSSFQRPSSGPTTPHDTTGQQNHHAFHYGNRNLSPLFKAARTETPPRPSSLRQEISCNYGSTADSAIDVNSPPPHLLQNSPQYRKHQSPHQYFSPPDFSLDAQGYNAQQPRRFPPPPPPPHMQSYNPDRSVTSNAAWAQGSESLRSPHTSEAHDIRTMEDDLRRILKLNVLN